VAVATPSEVMSRVSHGSAANGELVSVLVRGSSGTRWLTLYIGHVDEAQLVTAPYPLKAVGSTRDAAARLR